MLDLNTSSEPHVNPITEFLASINHHQHHPDVQRQGDLFYVAHFNAGLQVYDVSNTRLRVRSATSCRPTHPQVRADTGRQPGGPDRGRGRGPARLYLHLRQNQGIYVLRYIGPSA
ncbi:hypothetical protein ACWEPL_57540 [Nonomuraea sp. NPDC004186]